MKKRHLFLCVWLYTLLTAMPCSALPDARINEFHYDNAGSDAGEFVEIMVLDDDETDLSRLFCHLVNGSDGQIYKQKAVSEMTEGESDGIRTLYTWTYTGIQNGSPDGVALSYDLQVIEAISYEGELTGIDPPFNGHEFTAMDISESSATQIGESLYLTGVVPFTWTAGTDSPGEFNPGQILGDAATAVELSSFYSKIRNGTVYLIWYTESEVNNAGFILTRNDELIDKLNTASSGSETTRYSVTDRHPIPGKTSRYDLYSRSLDQGVELIASINVTVPLRDNCCLSLLAAPNPFNSSTCLEFELKRDVSGSVRLYDLSGKCIRTLKEGDFSKGCHEMRLNMENFSSGMYVVRYDFEGDITEQSIMHVK